MAGLGQQVQERSGVLAVLGAALAVVCLIGLHRNIWAVDLSALYFAGYFFCAGDLAQVYAAPPEVIGSQMPPAWVAAVAATGHGDEQTYPFIYPPWVAVLMAPVARFDPQSAMNANLLINVVLTLGSIGLAWRIIGVSAMSFPIWVLISLALVVPGVPLISAVLLGQTQILVFFLCLLAFERYIAGWFIAAGIALALAACIKITPAAFVLIFLFDRNRRALAAFLLTGAAMLAISIAVAGVGLHQTYLAHLGTINAHIYASFFAFSFETFLFETLNALRGTAPLHVENEYIFAKPGWISAVSKLGLLIATGVLWRVTRGDGAHRRTAARLLGLALIVALFAPLGWAHYYLLALFLLPGVLTWMPLRRAMVLLLSVAVTLSLPFQSAFFDLALPVYPQILIMVPVFLATLIALLVAFRQANPA